MLFLAFSFFLTAALYASVGFGGGSTYNALLVLAEVDYRLIPIIALLCNVAVVSGGTFRYMRAGYLRLGVAVPFLLFSVPLALVGGATPISKELFTLVLGLGLLASGLAILARASSLDLDVREYSPVARWLLGGAFGAGLGFLAGIAGIGGGIFLAPVMYFLRIASPRVIAATSSLFILINSLAGLGGQAFKYQGEVGSALIEYLWLVPAVVVGGQIGSYASIKGFSAATLRRITAVLMFYVGVRLLFTWYQFQI